MVVEWGVIPLLPKIVDEILLPLGLVYPEPLILRYFPSPDPFLVGVGDPVVLRELHSKALKLELWLMVTTVLGADYYCTDLCSWVGTAIVAHLGFVCSSGVLPISVRELTDDPGPAELFFGEVRTRCELMRSCPMR